MKLNFYLKIELQILIKRAKAHNTRGYGKKEPVTTQKPFLSTQHKIIETITNPNHHQKNDPNNNLTLTLGLNHNQQPQTATTNQTLNIITVSETANQQGLNRITRR